MSNKLFRLLIIFMTSGFVIGNIVAQSTPTPDEIDVSLFPDEACESTCWRGLIPGQSTSADVEEVLIELEDQLRFWRINTFNPVVDAETGYLINGSYRFVWKGDRNTTMSNNRNVISIENSVVVSIRLVPNDPIPIEEIIATLDEPDDIHFVTEYQAYYLKFIYLNELMEITYRIPLPCTVAKLDDDAVVWILYHNYEDASEFVETDYGLQPRLLAYLFYASASLERQVSLDTFDLWLNSEEDMDCYDVWEILPETIELPEFPEPESTETPTTNENTRQGESE